MADQEKRRDERVSTELPVNLGTATGMTRDVSASGMYFETDAALAHGSEIRFSVDLEAPAGGRMRLNCRGTIVRIEPRGAGVGVAVEIDDSAIETVS